MCCPSRLHRQEVYDWMKNGVLVSWLPILLSVNARSDSLWFRLKLRLLLVRRCSLSRISACDVQSWSDISHAGTCCKSCWLFLCIKMRTAVIDFILFMLLRLLRNWQFNLHLGKDLAFWQYPIRNTQVCCFHPQMRRHISNLPGNMEHWEKEEHNQMLQYQYADLWYNTQTLFKSRFKSKWEKSRDATNSFWQLQVWKGAISKSH